MANSSTKLLRDPFQAPPTRTPGPLGHRDACSPETPWWFVGDTPGPLGKNDHADPRLQQIADLAAMKDASAALRMRILQPVASNTRLGQADFEEAAKSLGNNISVAIIRAFAEVESGGRSGFGPNGLPIVAFEGHVFRKYTHSKYDDIFPQLSYRYVKKSGPQWRKNNKNQGTAWVTLDSAMKLDLSAALKASSWGMFQVMGFNHASCGYKTVQAFVFAMKSGERGQLNAFIGFCKASKGLVDALSNTDFQTIARLYNGQDFGDYDVQIEKAYKKHHAK